MRIEARDSKHVEDRGRSAHCPREPVFGVWTIVGLDDGRQEAEGFYHDTKVERNQRI